MMGGLTEDSIAHKLAIWLLNAATTCMESQHHLFNMFTKFPGLLTVHNFAKANVNVCVSQKVGKKLDVVATDEAAFFIKHCPCRNELTNIIKISYCWLNQI